MKNSSSQNAEAETILDSSSQPETSRQRLAECLGRLKTMDIRVLLTNVTVEPVAFLWVIATVMQAVVVQQLVSEQSCRVTLNRTEEFCVNVTDIGLKRELKGAMADYNLYTKTLIVGPSLFFALILGSLCDRNGPKLLILSSLLGDLVSTSILATISYVRLLPPEMTLIAHAVKGVTGGHMAFFLGVDNYLVVNSSSDSRTVRLGMLWVAFLAGTPLGYLLGGQLFSNRNFTRVFLVSLGIYVLTIAYLVLRLRREPLLRTSAGRALRDAFSLTEVKASLTVLCQKRPGSNRMYVILSILCANLLLFPQSGESTMIFPFTQLKFNFTVKDFSNYDAFQSGVLCFGTLTILPLFSYVLKVNDLILGMVSVCLGSAAAIITALSTTPLGLYLEAPLQIGVTGGTIVCRSLGTKCVDQSEQGKLSACHGLISAGVPIISGLVYDGIFHATMATFPGASFLLSAVLVQLPAIILAWIFFHMRRNKSSSIVSDQVELLEEPESCPEEQIMS